MANDGENMVCVLFYDGDDDFYHPWFVVFLTMVVVFLTMVVVFYILEVLQVDDLTV